MGLYRDSYWSESDDSHVDLIVTERKKNILLFVSVYCEKYIQDSVNTTKYGKQSISYEGAIYLIAIHTTLVKTKVYV